MKPLAWIAPIATTGLTARGAWAVERFPPPDFTDHELPQLVVPPAEWPWLEYVWVGLLLIGLGLTTYFALRVRSRKGLLLTAVGALVLFGFVRGGCICSIGAIQNVALGIADPTYAVPWVVVAFFVLPLVFALFVGRVFCASVCPLGAVQEMVALKPLQVPRWIDDALGLIAYVYLGLAVLLAATGAGFIICRYDPFVGFFRLGATVNMLVFGGALLVIGVFIGRPYCRYLCPLGVLLRWGSRVSRHHVRIPPDECIHCRLCEEACPYGAIREPTVPLTAEARRAGRRRLLALIGLLPVLVGVGFFLGGWLTGPLSRMHPTVRLAEQVHRYETAHREERGLDRPTPTDPSGPATATDDDQTAEAVEAFRNTGRPNDALYDDARRQMAVIGWGSGLFGAWVGLVVGGKLIALNLRRRRIDWQPDRGACVSCGRCFWYCPGSGGEKAES